MDAAVIWLRATRIMIVVCLLLAVYTVLVFIWSGTRISSRVRLPRFDAQQSPYQDGSAVLVPETGFEKFVPVFRKRNIFTVQDPEQEATTAHVQKAPPPRPAPVINLSQRFEVVGIVIDKQSTVALRNRSTGETIFLNEGESLEGAQVQSIRAGEIIFDIQGQSVTLTP